MITIAIITLLIFLVLGVPVSFAIGLSGLLAIVMGSDVPSFMAVQQAIRGMNSFSLMAGPLFILAGEILGAAKLSKRILDFCRACISQLRGGLGMVCRNIRIGSCHYERSQYPYGTGTKKGRV